MNNSNMSPRKKSAAKKSCLKANENDTLTMTLNQEEIQAAAAGRPSLGNTRRVSFLSHTHVRPISKRRSSIAPAASNRLQSEISNLNSETFGLDFDDETGAAMADQGSSSQNVNQSNESMATSDGTSFDQQSFEVPIHDLPSTPMLPSPAVKRSQDDSNMSIDNDSIGSPTGSDLDAIQQSFLSIVPAMQMNRQQLVDDSDMEITDRLNDPLQQDQQSASDSDDDSFPNSVNMDETLCDGMILDDLMTENLVPPTPAHIETNANTTRMDMTTCVGKFRESSTRMDLTCVGGIKSRVSDMHSTSRMEMTTCVGRINDIEKAVDEENETATITTRIDPLIAFSASKKEGNPFERHGFAANIRRRLSFAQSRISMGGEDMDMTKIAGEISEYDDDTQMTATRSAPVTPTSRKNVSLFDDHKKVPIFEKSPYVKHILSSVNPAFAVKPMSAPETEIEQAVKPSSPTISSQFTKSATKQTPPYRRSRANSPVPVRRSPRLNSPVKIASMKTTPIKKVTTPVENTNNPMSKSSSRASSPVKSNVSSPKTQKNANQVKAASPLVPSPVKPQEGRKKVTQSSSLPEKESVRIAGVEPLHRSVPSSPHRTPPKRILGSDGLPPVARTPLSKPGSSHKRTRLHISVTAEELTNNTSSPDSQTSPTPKVVSHVSVELVEKSPRVKPVKESVEDESFSEMYQSSRVGDISIDVTEDSNEDVFADNNTAPIVSLKAGFENVMSELNIDFFASAQVEDNLTVCVLDASYLSELEYYHKACEVMEKMITNNESYVIDLETQVSGNFWNLVASLDQHGSSDEENIIRFKELMGAAKVMVDTQVQMEWQDWCITRLQPYMRDIFIRLQMLENEVTEVEVMKKKCVPEIDTLNDELEKVQTELSKAEDRMTLLQGEGPAVAQLRREFSTNNARIVELNLIIADLDAVIPQIEFQQEEMSNVYSALEKQKLLLNDVSNKNEREPDASAVIIVRNKYELTKKMFLWEVVEVQDLSMVLKWRSCLLLTVDLTLDLPKLKLSQPEAQQSKALSKMIHACNSWMENSTLTMNDIPKVWLMLPSILSWMQQLDGIHAACPVDLSKLSIQDSGCMLEAKSSFFQPPICAFWNGLGFHRATNA